jgi:hypothetical protein
VAAPCGVKARVTGVADEALSIADVTALESDYVDRGQPSLLAPRSALVERWELGCRDRETALRLAFLDWYSCSEPDFLTGMPELSASDASFFGECSEHLLVSYYDDEVGFVLGWMMKSFPYCCGAGPVSDWLSRGESLGQNMRLPAEGRIRPSSRVAVLTGTTSPTSPRSPIRSAPGEGSGGPNIRSCAVRARICRCQGASRGGV